MYDLFPETAPGIAEQIAEVRRELALRERNYSGFIRRGFVTAAKADRQMATLRAVLATLETLQQRTA